MSEDSSSFTLAEDDGVVFDFEGLTRKEPDFNGKIMSFYEARTRINAGTSVAQDFVVIDKNTLAAFLKKVLCT